MPKRHHIIQQAFKRTLQFISIVILTLLLLECILRLKGHQLPPARPVQKKPIMQLDEQLGWKHIPGEFLLPPNSASLDSVNITIANDGSRKTSTNTVEYKDELLFIGGSFTFGWGLSNQEHVAWKVQNEIKNLKIKNKAVGAYGTYQSLLVLEDELKNGKRPKQVIYGYIAHHKLRNVAEGNWAMLMHDIRGTQHVKVPYVTVNASGKLLRHDPFEVYQIPLARQLVSIYSLQVAYLNFQSKKRVENANGIFEKLVLKMQELCKTYDIDFHVAILYEEPKEIDNLTSFFQHNDIPYIDCNVPLSHENTIENDGHPIQSVHTEWAERIVKRLRDDNPLSNQ